MNRRIRSYESATWLGYKGPKYLIWKESEENSNLRMWMRILKNNQEIEET